MLTAMNDDTATVCPRCGAATDPAPGDYLTLPEPPTGTRLDIEGSTIERYPDGWGWVDDHTRFGWPIVQRIAAAADDPRLTVLRWGARTD
jgi:hypothetical protein